MIKPDEVNKDNPDSFIVKFIYSFVSEQLSNIDNETVIVDNAGRTEIDDGHIEYS
jgi:hypothetical protein